MRVYMYVGVVACLQVKYHVLHVLCIFLKIQVKIEGMHTYVYDIEQCTVVFSSSVLFHYLITPLPFFFRLVPFIRGTDVGILVDGLYVRRASSLVSHKRRNL